MADEDNLEQAGANLERAAAAKPPMRRALFGVRAANRRMKKWSSGGGGGGCGGRNWSSAAPLAEGKESGDAIGRDGGRRAGGRQGEHASIARSPFEASEEGEI